MITAKKIEGIPDPALFEKLATDVLRYADPRYVGLIHTGVNTDGKTVKSPLDGIYTVPESSPLHFMIVHHTTAKRDDLENKWLYDSKGKKSKTPDGDVAKAIQWAKEQRKQTPDTKVTLVLTCNKIPPHELISQTTHICRKEDIILDIWDCSRIESYLDNKPDGQWLRKKYLGMYQERLSLDLLTELSGKSCEIYKESLFFADGRKWIDRTLDQDITKGLFESGRRGLFVVADSGFGKSTTSYRILHKHILCGGVGLWLSQKTIEGAANIHTAVENTLKDLYPSIETGCGYTAFELLNSENPLLLVIDDINKTSKPSNAVEQVASWIKEPKVEEKGGSENQGFTYRIICPLWPQVLFQVSEQARQTVNSLCYFGDAFNPEEGSEAIRKASEVNGWVLTDLQAEEISKTLGHDPLLISIWGQADDIASVATESSAVIEGFIKRQLKDLSSRHGRFTATDYHDALLSLSLFCLQERNLIPSWDVLRKRFNNGRDLEMLWDIAGQQTICRLEETGGIEQLVFRHDRIRDFLLSFAIHKGMSQNNISDECLSEPYSAELIGQALLLRAIDLSWVQKIKQLNPLVLFCSFRFFCEPKTEIQFYIVERIRQWLKEEVATNRCIVSLRWEIERVLAETDSSLVGELSSYFPMKSTTLLMARFRNGDVEAGAEFCKIFDPHASAPWRDRLIRHTYEKYGIDLVVKAGALLATPDLSEDLLVGGLNLAGYLGDDSFLPYIKKCWDQNKITPELLTSFIWAAARCCNENPELVIDPMLVCWASLPDADKPRSENKNGIAYYSLRFSLGRYNISESVVRYFIKHADGPLESPLVMILEHIDNPDAMEFIVGMAAQKAKEIEGKKIVSLWSMLISEQWDKDRGGRILSALSQQRLKTLWVNDGNDRYLRQKAFDLWCLGADKKDIAVLRSIDETSPLYDAALMKRMKVGDISVAKDVIKKLATAKYPLIWWQLCDQCWCKELKDVLDQHFEKRGRTVKKEWDAEPYTDDDEVSTLMIKIPHEDAEELLLKHWGHLRYSADFVQVALYLATPRCKKIAADTIAACPEPAILFIYLDHKFGFITIGRQEKITLKQLESIRPYLDLLGKHTIWSAWEWCNRRGFFEWRRANLDQRFAADQRKQYGLDDVDVVSDLDEFINGKKRIRDIDFWIDDFKNKGEPMSRIMNILKGWLEDKKTLEAFDVAARGIAFGGSRDDLGILTQDWLPKDIKVSQSIENTRFAVIRRTLV